MVSHASVRNSNEQELTGSLGAPGDWSHITSQTGMFAILGLPLDVVLQLKSTSRNFNKSDIAVAMLTLSSDEFHVYMAENSRISIAGLNTKNVDYVAKSIVQCLKPL